MIGAREAALLSLCDILYDGKYSNIAVNEMLRKCHAMDRKDKSLYTTIVYGVLVHYYTLEYIISLYSSVKVKKLARYVKVLLLIGLYQIKYLDKVPDSAAVNESVKLSKRYCKKDSDRFVNAVLRRAIDGGSDIPMPDDEIERICVEYSFSYQMAKQLCDIFGIERAVTLMASLNMPPQTLLRPNVLKTDLNSLIDLLKGDGIEATEQDSMIAVKGFDIGNSVLYKDGYFTVQDRGAYTASVVLDPQSGETIIDMCAAPGGKTTHIAELMGDSGKIIAFDIHEHKIKLIVNTAKRLGIKSIDAKTADATVYNPALKESADRVLCDVPCSGWGIIRRKPDIKLSHTDLDDLYITQKSILSNGAAYVKKGGCIVYSTCTLNSRENEEVIREFLDNNNEFVKTYEKTFYPDMDNSDGFFICRLDRK